MERIVFIKHQDIYTNKAGKTYDLTKGFTFELVEDFDGVYYINIAIGNERVKGLPDYVDYRTLKKAVKEETSIELPNRKDINMYRFGRKRYITVRTEGSKYWWQCDNKGNEEEFDLAV